MSNLNYIIEMLELKDSNIFFKENFYYKEKINNIIHKIFEGYLSYTPDFVLNAGLFLIKVLKNMVLFLLILKSLMC